MEQTAQEYIERLIEQTTQEEKTNLMKQTTQELIDQTKEKLKSAQLLVVKTNNLVKNHEQTLKELEVQLKREATGRHVFPPGFKFGYNDRRGDPQFTPYWYLTLNDANGRTVFSESYDINRCQDAIKADALDRAWKLVDIADAIMHARQTESKSDEISENRSENV